MREMEPRLVRQEAALETARSGVARFGTRTVKIPSFFAGVASAEDLKILLAQPLPNENLGGLVVPLHAADQILRVADRHDLDYSRSFVGERWRDLKDRLTILVDPVPEIFYVKRPGLRTRVANLEGAPLEFFDGIAAATSENYLDAWAHLPPSTYLELVDWMARYQTMVGAEVVLPMTPLVAEASKRSVDLAIKSNSMAASYLTAGTHDPGLYFALNYPLFRSREFVMRLAEGVDQLVDMWAPHALVIRLRGLPSVEADDDDPLMGNLATFLLYIGSIGRKFGLPIVLLNSGTYGFAALGTGTDIFSETLNGNIGDPFDSADADQKKKKGFAAGFLAGRVYHPVHKINLARRDFEVALEADGGFPEISLSAPPMSGTSDLDFRRQAKHYRAAARADEAFKMKEAIRGSEPRALAEEFARSRARNAEKLVPNRF
jgi:hypothetical protein